ncbi:MAG: formate dehydrogenase accessory sulfurtransferase FdhD [Methanobacteriaceae archaeon]|jgi:formate dehydrogenase accessory protein FdhD|nr:formate dehydrogenase accessory sulfurtransferase FdhD [Methanobacteriaceae archaeon]
MKNITEVDALKFKNDKKAEIKEKVVIDSTINLNVNNENIGNFSAIKDSLKEFSVGYLLGSNTISSIDEIKDIKINEHEINIEIKNNFKSKERVLCSDAAGGLREKIKNVNIIDSDFKIKAHDIIENMNKLTNNAKIWKNTGGAHVAALISKDDFIIKEDVSRHVAVDKVIGAGALKGIDFKNSYIVYSGRMPADMVIKLNNVGIPIIASNAAPTNSGFLIVKESNMTMVGFLRGNDFNLYGNYERIIF